MSDKWPITEGRYVVGNPSSPVAICTMASMDLIDKFPMENIAVVGKTVTENLGIEKIISNIVSNRYIRYLICCGKVSKGHFVEDALECLIRNGVDEQKRIIGAKGAMPVLKNSSAEEINIFRKQVTPINLAGIEDVGEIMKTVNGIIEKKPAPFVSNTFGQKKEAEKVQASSDDSWTQDPKGFFVISVDDKNIVVKHHDNKGRHLKTFIGETPEDIYKEIIKAGLVSLLGHAAYLGKELYKAGMAIEYGLRYEQDSVLAPLAKQ